MRVGKKLLIAGTAAAIIAAVAVALLMHNIDSIVKRAIEKYGSEAAGVDVTVGQVSIDLGNGRGTIRGLSVGNPPGFSRNKIFQLDEITLRLDLASLTGKVPVVEEIRVIAPRLRYELGTRGESNLAALQRNLARRQSTTATTKGGAESQQKETRLRIRQLTIKGAQADIDLGVKRRETVLPPIVLKEIGGRRGATPDEIGAATLAALAGGLEREVLQRGGDLSRKGISGALKKLLGD